MPKHRMSCVGATGSRPADERHTANNNAIDSDDLDVFVGTERMVLWLGRSATEARAPGTRLWPAIPPAGSGRTSPIIAASSCGAPVQNRRRSNVHPSRLASRSGAPQGVRGRSPRAQAQDGTGFRSGPS